MIANTGAFNLSAPGNLNDGILEHMRNLQAKDIDFILTGEYIVPFGVNMCKQTWNRTNPGKPKLYDVGGNRPLVRTRITGTLAFHQPILHKM